MSLIPEKPLLISPTLASTVGLEEAILLQVLGEVVAHTPLNQSQQRTGNNNSQWHEISAVQLQQFLPFWQVADLQRITTSLRDKGVLQTDSAPLTESNILRFALESSQSQHAATPSNPLSAPIVHPKSTNLISGTWQPCKDTVRQLSQYNIPQQFIELQIPEFVSYWSERGEPQYSWGNKFIKRVLHAWRSEQQNIARQGQNTPMQGHWRPSRDALELLIQRSGIHQNFCEDAIPEFVLYWQERGDPSSTWNSQFVSHVKRQWARYQNAMENDTEPRALSSNWQPSESLFEVLRLANIPRDFAQQQIAEFVLYWQENGQISSSWNTKFLQQVKRQWARHSHWQQDNSHDQSKGHERQQNAARSISTRNRSLEEDLSDRSWAQ